MTNRAAIRPTDAVLRRLWLALRDVEDPEIPVSIVDMGLIISVSCEAGAALVQMTYTSMGCPAMEMIQDDIRARLMREPDIENVEIEVVWDPVWTPERLSNAAKETMRELGIAV
jgi:phenylacetate-CoA oxygenase PaaJ subunit